MSTDIYNYEKLQNFKDTLNEYNNKKNNYVKSLEKFNKKVENKMNKHVDNRENGKKHKLYQVGLDDLNSIKYSYLQTGILTNKDNIEFEDTAVCNEGHLKKCSSRAKTTNKPHYGMTVKNSDGGCICYTLDDVKKNTPVSIEIVDRKVTSILGTPSYLSILMDGDLYSINKSNYSDNFSKLYEKNDGDITKLTNNGISTSCHPFSGGGINTLSINGIDTHGTNNSAKCMKK